MNEIIDHKKRVALVTGGASGIGAEISRRLVHDGLTVVVGDVDAAAAHALVSELGENAFALNLDVTSMDSCHAAIADVQTRFGRLDVVVANAGIGGDMAPVWETAESDWLRIMDVNLNGVYRTLHAAVPLMMRKLETPRIVITASIAGKEGNPFLSAYSASKAGVIGLCKALGKELTETGILVNAIAPALISTPMLEAAPKAAYDALVSKIPMNRVGQASEVAALVSWLSSSECSYSTGAVFDLSGGRATY